LPRYYCLLLLPLLLLPACQQPETTYKVPPSISLTKGWKFKMGDDIDYSRTDLTDSGWKPIEVEKDWQNQGYPEYFGYAGYYIKTVIPSSLKTGLANDSLKINLGFIAFYDQVYLNGHLLGENNVVLPDTARGDPDFKNKFPGLLCFRCYKIAASDSRIRWDHENTIAVRVYSDLDNGGLWGGRPGIAMERLDEFIVFDKSRFYTIINQERMDTLLILRNKNSRVTFSGDLDLSATNTVTNRELFSYKRKGLQLHPNDSLAIPISLPLCIDPIRFRSRFTETGFKVMASDSTDIPFVLIK